jgi:hypothetical protein
MSTLHPDLNSFDENHFKSRYNRSSFEFSHKLNSDPLFDLQSILDLALSRRRDPSLAYWSNGRVAVADSWAAGTGGKASLQDTLEHIENNDSLVMLKRVDQDEKFGPTVRRIIDSLMDLAGPQMRDDVTIGRGTLLVASPRRITSYHIDADTNFLFQIRGGKTFYVYDNNDRTLVTNEQLEQYFAGDPSAAKLPPERRGEGVVYDLRGGSAVHVPSASPHWAQNLDDVSVALSLNFDLRSVERIADVFRINRRLRKWGLRPAPPHQSPWRDELKLAAGSMARRVKRYLHPGASGDSLLR